MSLSTLEPRETGGSPGQPLLSARDSQCKIKANPLAPTNSPHHDGLSDSLPLMPAGNPGAEHHPSGTAPESANGGWQKGGLDLMEEKRGWI